MTEFVVVAEAASLRAGDRVLVPLHPIPQWMIVLEDRTGLFELEYHIPHKGDQMHLRLHVIGDVTDTYLWGPKASDPVRVIRNNAKVAA